MARYKKRFRPQRQHRYEVLRGELFTHAEAKVISEFPFSFAYIKHIRQHRAEQVNNAFTWAYARGGARDDAIKRLRASIKRQYQREGWVNTYGMVRKERDKSLARGEYVPPVRRRRPRLSRGNVQAQKARYRERKAAQQPYEVYGSEGQVVGHVVWNPTEGRFIRVD